MKLSVVVPLYNEEECVRPMVEELLPIAVGVDPECELVLVNDGSNDGTDGRIRELQAQWPDRIRYVKFAKNCGQTAAIDAGFKFSRGDVIAVIDGDMQVDPADLPMMVELTSKYDVVHGWRWQRKDTWFKRVQTKIANRIRNWLTKSDVQDTGCPIKVFRKEVVRTFKLYKGLHRFFVTLARMEGFTTHEVKVRHRPRAAGVSKYGMWNRVFRALRDLFAVRWMMARHYRYDASEVAPPSKSAGGATAKKADGAAAS